MVAIKEALDALEGRPGEKIDQLEREIELANTRVKAYQKALIQVANLAFGSIATATVTVIPTVVLK